MAQPKNWFRWQNTVDRYQSIINEMKGVIADPDTSPEDQSDAQRIVTDTRLRLAELATKHGARPTMPS